MDHIFTYIVVFNLLELLQEMRFPTKIPMDPDLLSLPQHLKHKRPVPHLTEIKSLDRISYYWYFDRGWASIIFMQYDAEQEGSQGRFRRQTSAPTSPHEPDQ